MLIRTEIADRVSTETAFAEHDKVRTGFVERVISRLAFFDLSDGVEWSELIRTAFVWADISSDAPGHLFSWVASEISLFYLVLGTPWEFDFSTGENTAYVGVI